MGETIVDEEGRLAYLKTFRLSQGQVRRGHLLSRLAASDWNLEEAARAVGTDAEGLALRLERSGFGHLLRQDVLDHYRAQGRRRLTRRRVSTRQASARQASGRQTTGRRTSAQNTNPSRLWHSRM
jgi:hypothetical protein